MGNAWCNKDDNLENGDNRGSRNEDPPTGDDHEDTASEKQDTKDTRAANNRRDKRRDRGLEIYDSCDDVWIDRMWLDELKELQILDTVGSGHDCGEYCGDCDLECHEGPDCSDCGECGCD